MSDMEFPEPFDPETEEGNSWELIPVGEYVAQAVEGRIAPPKSNDGYALTLTWKILEGEHEGRQVWQHITYMHSNEQAETIGRKTVKDICTALGINEQVRDAEIFLFKPARIRIGIQKDKQGVYADQNKISRVMPLVAAAETPRSGNGNQTGSAPSLADTDRPPVTIDGKPPVPRTRGPSRPGPAGTAPWHKSK
jgi:hypothetical protein